jgi:hypothetical protein
VPKDKPADLEDLAGACLLLAPFRCFQLTRISSTTYVKDTLSSVALGVWYGDITQRAITAGNAYRARISKDPYCFGTTATAAAEEAVKRHNERKHHAGNA